jgi:LPS O-antigen subunit length determinant protein (WzzB/FepE family)
MAKNFLQQSSDEINFSKIIKNFWDEKILFLVVSVVSILIFYFSAVLYEKISGKKYKIEFSINHPTSQLFSDFLEKFSDDFASDKSIRFSSANYIYLSFINRLDSNITSLDNIDLFLEQSKDFIDFKVFLKEKKISPKMYFLSSKSGLIEIKDKNSNIKKFIFIYPEQLDGKNFLINYFDFSKQKTFDEFSTDMKIYVRSKIKSSEDALLIAKSIGLKKPAIIEKSFNNNPKDLFYIGTDALEARIKEYREFLTIIDNSSLINNKKSLNELNILPFYEEYRGYPNFFYVLLGLLFGFILSSLIIFFKSFLKENK